MVSQNYYQFNATLFHWDYFLRLLLKHFLLFFFISWLKEKKISLKEVKEEAKKLKALLIFKKPICKNFQVNSWQEAGNKFSTSVHPERLF